MSIQFLKNDQLGRPDLETYRRGEKMPVTVILDNVRSGLNTGSVFRTADSFMVEQIICCGITAQPPDRDVLKSALGATESVKWSYQVKTIDAIANLKKEGYKIFAIEQGDTSVSLEDICPEPGIRYALVFGHEVKGVDSQLIPLLDGCIEIPQSGIKHSLNVAVCAGIVLWKFYETIILKKA